MSNDKKKKRTKQEDEILVEKPAEVSENTETEEVEEAAAENLEEVSEEVNQEDNSEENSEEKKDDSVALSADEGESLEDNSELSAEDGEALEPELSAAEGETLVELELSEEEGEELEPEGKGKKIWKILGYTALGTLGAVYLGFAIFFTTHFYFQTTINGTDFSMQRISVVEEHMTEQVGVYELTIKESDGDQEKIDGDNIALVYKKTDELGQIMKSQNPFLWPISLFQKSDIQASIGVSYDDAKLTELINGFACILPENQVAPVSATPEYKDGKFVVKPEEIGSTLEMEAFNKKIREAIEGFQDTLDLVEAECYVKAPFLKDSPEVQAACDEMNTYLGAEVTYTFGENTEKMDGSVIAQWLSVDENMAVVYNANGPAEYVASLAEKYDTFKKERSFTSGSGNTVTVKGGNYGWRIDQKTETEALTASVTNKEVVTKEPAYLQKAAVHGDMDWGNTFVEVDLSRQYMYLIVDGAVVTQNHIVTGKPSEGSATPQGVYSIKYCQSPARLRGPKKPDGTYEWDSPVSFWMPFNGGIGLHDAPWQAAFGGRRYLTHGSHGCVNLPFNTAKIVYNNVSAGTPVVCHY